MRAVQFVTILVLSLNALTVQASDTCNNYFSNFGHYKSIVEDNKRLRDLQDPKRYTQAVFDRYPVKAIENFSRFYRWKTRLKARATTWLVAKNHDPFPQHYINGTRSEFIQVIDHFIWKPHDSEEWKASNHQILEWIETYKSYRHRVQAVVDEGFTAMRRLPILEPLFEGKNAYTYDNWPDDGVTLELPLYENGEYSESTRHWPRIEDFQKYVREQRNAIVRTFSLNKLDEMFRKSEIFDELLEQAELNSMLIYIKGELKKKNRNRIKDYHEEVLIKVEEALEDDALSPRDDATRDLQAREFKQEWRHFLKSFSLFKQSSYADKLGLSDKTSQALSSNGWLKRIVTTLKPFIWVGLASSGYATGKFIFVETGFVGEAVAVISRSLDDASREIFGATARERSCAAQDRDFSFWICYGELATNFLGPELVIARDNPNYDLRSEEISMKLELYEQHMLRLRKEMRNAEAFAFAVNKLNERGVPMQALEEAAQELIMRKKIISTDMEDVLKDAMQALFIAPEAKVNLDPENPTVEIVHKHAQLFEMAYGINGVQEYAQAILEMGDDFPNHWRNNWNLNPLIKKWDLIDAQLAAEEK